MNLKSLTDDVLLSRTTRLADTERRVTSQVLLCLLEIDQRRLFAELGFSSLFDYCVRNLKYSESAAYRRISAMRLLRDVPAVEEKIQSGELSISTACQVQSFCASAKKLQNKVFTAEEKAALILEVQSKSARDCEKILADKVPQAVPAERLRAITANQTEIRFVADDELMAALTRVRELGAHKLNGVSDYATLFKMMAEVVLNKIDPARRKARTPLPTSNVPGPETKDMDKGVQTEAACEPKPEVQQEPKPEAKIAADFENVKPTGARSPSRHIPAGVRHEVWNRDQGRCTFVHAETGRRFESKFGLEYDHVQPFALDGETTTENLRLCCRQHNSIHANRVFGAQFMAQFVSGGL